MAQAGEWMAHVDGEWTSIGTPNEVRAAIRAGKLHASTYVAHETLVEATPLSSVPWAAAALEDAQAMPAAPSHSAGPIHQETLRIQPPAEPARSPVVDNSLLDAPPTKVHPAAVSKSTKGAASGSPIAHKHLLQGEEILSGAFGRGVVVTSCRVRSESTRSDGSDTREIFLEDISYAAVTTTSIPRLRHLAAVLGLLSIALGIATDDTTPAIASAFIGLLSIIAYVLTRRQELVVASSGGQIQMSATSVPRETIEYLLRTIAEAKDARVRQLRRP